MLRKLKRLSLVEGVEGVEDAAQVEGVEVPCNPERSEGTPLSSRMCYRENLKKVMMFL